MRLKVNEGTYKTPCKFNVSESCTVPIWVTKACSPFGKDTKVFMVEVIVVKRDYWVYHMVYGTSIYNPLRGVMCMSVNYVGKKNSVLRKEVTKKDYLKNCWQSWLGQ